MIGANQNKAGYLSIASLDEGLQTRINSSIIRMSVDYTMNMSSELSFDVIDIGGEMLSRNYFQVTRDVLYTTNTFSGFEDTYIAAQGGATKGKVIQAFEIANVTIGEGPGYNPLVQVKCYTKSIQQMKRDRAPQNVKGDGAEYVRAAARKYGLRCFAEKTSQKKQINKASGDKQAESLWNVLENLASESKFVLFEADGILFFCSQKFLLNQWGSEIEYVNIKNPKPKGPKRKQKRYIPIAFGNDIDRLGSITSKSKNINNILTVKNDFMVMRRPSVTISENDPLEATGSLIVDRANGTQLRPGMTIRLLNFNDYSGDYLIDTVSFPDISVDPVAISFRKPEKEEKDRKQLVVGERYKATTFSNFSEEQPMPLKISKNTKENKMYTDVEATRKLLQIAPGELPTDVGDQRVRPLPSRVDLYRYPRISEALAYGKTPLTPLDMYNRPTVINNSKPSSIYAMAVAVQSQSGFNDGDPYVAIIPRVVLDEANHPLLLDDVTASTQFIADISASLNPQFIAKLPNVEVNPIWYTGNIDLFSRPIFVNTDKSISTVYSTSFYEESTGKEVLVPQVLSNSSGAYIATAAQAQAEYEATGKHLGKFDTVLQANAAAEKIHNQQEKYYSLINKLENKTSVSAKSLWKAKVEDYIKLCNLQEVEVMTLRFGKAPLLADSSIFPIPTSASPSTYPYLGTGVIETGNIPLYSMPVKVQNGEPLIGRIQIYYPFYQKEIPNIVAEEYGGQAFALILPTVISSGGEVIVLTYAAALEKYKLDKLNGTESFLAKCVSLDYAAMYGNLLIDQLSQVLISRFPDENFVDTP